MKRLFSDSHSITKLIAIGLILLVPFQVVAYRVADKPWPNLQMPSFSAAPSVPRHFALLEILANRSDGERLPVAWEDLFPGIPGIDRSFQSLHFSPRREPPDAGGTGGKIADELGSRYPFSNYWQFRLGTPHGNDPGVQLWLSERLSELFEGQSFDSLEFIWYEHEGFARTEDLPASAVAEVYVVDLR